MKVFDRILVDLELFFCKDWFRVDDVWKITVKQIHETLFLISAEPILDRKRHLIGDEFFKQPSVQGPNSFVEEVNNSKSSGGVVVSGEDHLTSNRIPTIVAPSTWTIQFVTIHF